MSKLWRIYDELIAGVPDNLVVEKAIIGKAWTAICSQAVGLAMTVPGPGEAPTERSLVGKKVKEVAKMIKSWDFQEAAVGLAAINSYLNTEKQVANLLAQNNFESQTAFDFALEAIEGKKVAVIGHFPDTEKMAERAEVTIFERNPQTGDVPDTAEEYLLPDQDVVFITSVTLTNKTLPRLLQLAANARVFIVGPGTPISPILFDHGISCISGSFVVDPEKVFQSIISGDCAMRFIRNGSVKLVNITKQ